MAPSLRQKLISRTKSAPKPRSRRTLLSLEAIEDRVLPSVSTVLKGGVLKIIADARQGTSQVEIIQSPDQITVEDTGTVVNSFDPTQIQQIDFKYRELQHQHTKFDLNIPVTQGQMTLTGAAISEADFDLGDGSLTATVNATLPDGTPINLGGAVNTDGTFDLAGAAAIQVDNYPLDANFDLSDQALTVNTHLSIPSIAEVDLSGSLDGGGNYDLTGTADLTTAGFTLAGSSFELTNGNLAVQGDVNLAGMDLPLSGSVTAPDQVNLTGTAAIMVAHNALPANFTLTNTSLAVATAITLGTNNTVDLNGTVDSQGHYNLSGTGTIPVAGFNLNANFNLTESAITAHTMLPVGTVGSVNLSGIYDNGQLGDLSGSGTVAVPGFNLTVNANYHNSVLTFQSTATIGSTNVNLSGTYANGQSFSLTGSADFTIAGFNVTPSFTFTSTGLSVAVGLSIPNVGSLNLVGTADQQGNFSVSAMPHVVIAGVGLDVAFHLTNASLAVSTTANLPIVGNVNLAGTTDNQGNFSLTTTVPNLTILFVTLTNASVTLTNNSLSVAAHASNLPLIGGVDFKGTITGNSYTFMVALPSVSILGFTLKNTTAALNSSSLSVVGHMDGIPLVGSADFNGSITSTGFSLSATVPNVNLLGFIHFANISLTLNGSSLSLSAPTALPVVGMVTFTGAISYDGSFTISATAPHFTVLGFLGIDNATVALQFPNPKLTVAAHLNLLNIGMADFTGSIGAGGTFAFDGSAALTVAGFTLGRANLHFGNLPGDPSDGIHIGPFTTAPLPVVGPVTLEGSYGSGGKFSFSVDVYPNPPIQLGPLPINHAHIGLSDDGQGHGSLTLGAGVGYTLAGGILDLSGYAQVTVSTTGDFQMVVMATASVLGFQAANGTWTLTKTGGNYQMTLDANLNLIVTTAHFHGDIDFTHGKFTFTAQQDLGVAGFTLSQTTFIATNVPDPVHYPGFDTRVELHSHTSLSLPPAFSATGNFDGKLLKSGSSYTITVHASAAITVAGLTLANATLDLDNTHVTFSLDWTYVFFTAHVSGTVTSDGDIQFNGNAQTASLAGFNLASTTVNVHINPRQNIYHIGVSGHINVFIAGFDFTINIDRGTQSWPQPTVTVSANVGGALSSILTGSAAFTVNSSMVSFDGSLGIPHVSGTFHVHGTVSHDGTVQINGGTVSALNSPAIQDAARILRYVDGSLRDIAAALKGVYVSTLADVAHALKYGISGTTLADVANALKYGISGTTPTSVANALWNGISGIYRSDVAGALWNGISGLYRSDIAGALWNGIAGTTLPNVANALEYGISGTTLTNVANALKYGINGTTLTNIANALWNGISGIYRSDVAGALWNGISGIYRSDVAGALWYGIAGTTLSYVANALKYGISGTTLTNVANALWNGISGIYRSDVAGALWNGIGGIYRSDVAGALWYGISGTTLPNVANALKYGISGTTLPNVANALKYGISGLSLANVANALWNGIGGIYRSDVAGALWNGIGGIYVRDVAGALWNGIGGTALSDVANALKYGISGLTLANVANGIWYGIGGINLANVAGALWHGIGGIYLRDVTNALWNGIGGISLANVANALWYGIGGINLANVANAVWYGISGINLPNVANALWYGIGGINLGNVASALWNGIGGINYRDVAGALWHGIGGISLTDVAYGLVDAFSISFAQAWAIVSSL